MIKRASVRPSVNSIAETEFELGSYQRSQLPPRSSSEYALDKLPPRSSGGFARDLSPRGSSGFAQDLSPRGGSGFPRDLSPRSLSGYALEKLPPRSSSGFARDQLSSRGSNEHARDRKRSKDPKVLEEFEKWNEKFDNSREKTEDEWSFLHYVSAHGVASLVTWLSDGGDVMEAEDKYGNAPLHHASERGHVEIVTILLRQGADVNHKNHRKESPHAISTGHIEMITTMLKGVSSKDGRASADLARKDRLTSICALLKEHGARVD